DVGAPPPGPPAACRAQRSRPAHPPPPRRHRRDRAALMHLQEVRDRGNAVLDEIERAIVGKRGSLELILAAALCDGHVLLEDYPALAKTLAPRSFAQATSLPFPPLH